MKATNRILGLCHVKEPNPAPNPIEIGVVAFVPPGFAVCPPQVVQLAAWQQELYRQAHEQARAAVETPRHHRLLFSVWN